MDTVINNFLHSAVRHSSVNFTPITVSPSFADSWANLKSIFYHHRVSSYSLSISTSFALILGSHNYWMYSKNYSSILIFLFYFSFIFSCVRPSLFHLSFFSIFSLWSHWDQIHVECVDGRERSPPPLLSSPLYVSMGYQNMLREWRQRGR